MAKFEVQAFVIGDPNVIVTDIQRHSLDCVRNAIYDVHKTVDRSAAITVSRINCYIRIQPLQLGVVLLMPSVTS